MMENDRKIVGHIDQPVYYVQPFEGDEIDLVDLWIIATNYKKTFLVSAFVLVIVSLIAITIKFEPLFSFKSIVELESVASEFRFAESPASFITRVEFSILPRMLDQTTDEALLDRINSVKLSNPKDTNLILLDNVIPSDQEKEYADFHQKLIDEILANEDLRLLSVRQKIQTEILSTEQKINNLNVNLEVLERKFELRTASLKAEFDEPDRLLADLEKEIRVEKNPLRIELKLLSSRASALELQKEMLVPTIILQSAMSDKPEGRSRVKLTVLAVFMSLFLALFVTMGVVFSQKVKQRRAGEG